MSVPIELPGERKPLIVALPEAPLPPNVPPGLTSTVPKTLPLLRKAPPFTVTFEVMLPVVPISRIPAVAVVVPV